MDETQQALPGPSEEQLGRTLRGLRLAIGLDLDRLAERSRLEPEVITALELGEHEADLRTLFAVADGLGVGLAAIMAMAERDTGPRSSRT